MSLDWLARLRAVVADTHPPPLLVIGGGAAADLVRAWQSQHQLTETQAHELALAAMGLNEQLATTVLPRSILVRNRKQLRAAYEAGRWPVLCSACFLPWAEREGHPPLPRSWDVTSDSIAAWVAAVLSAPELILCKSVPCPAGLSPDQAAQAGLVDRHFPQVAPGVPHIDWLNLREASPQVRPWWRSPVFTQVPTAGSPSGGSPPGATGRLEPPHTAHAAGGSSSDGETAR